MADELTYAYAVGDLELVADAELVGLPGVGRGIVRILSAGGLAALVSSVDERAFGEEALKQNLERLPWLEQIARAHHAVVETASRRHAVVPLRMVTIYLDDDGVREVLERNGTRFQEALDRIGGGRMEWGVKAYLTPAPADSTPDVPEGAGPGTSYLTRRRVARDRTDEWRAAAMHVAEQVHLRLSDSAVASRLHTPQDRRLTGRDDEMVLNAAYLVEERDAELFRQTVTGWVDQHLQLELTGPWAPYSFATVDES